MRRYPSREAGEKFPTGSIISAVFSIVGPMGGRDGADVEKICRCQLTREAVRTGGEEMEFR